ncbi:MAG: aryl-sulfate sulfotransferase [Ignavibacteriaceae bacterium]
MDYVHANALEVDLDGNILISSRHLDEITKIDRQTGKTIWRWGGEYCENNEFTFINDSIGFSHQHFIKKLSNGNITLFDNGNLHSPQFSRVAEYQLDEVNKFATLIWEYRNDPETFSGAMGSVNRLDNHNTIIGWGSNSLPAISEVKPDGEVVLFLSLPDTIYNYRGYKFPWKTNLFVGNPASLYFGYVPAGDSIQLQLEITNNSDQQIEINSIHNYDTAYTVLDTLPIALVPFGTDTLTVKFKPEIDKDYYDNLHLRWDTEGERIAQVIPLIGSGDTNFVSVEPGESLLDYTFSQNYPNPFNPSTTIKYQIPEISFVTIKVYDILGREVAALVNEEKPSGRYEVQFNSHSVEGRNLTSGIYFYQLKAGQFSETKKMILLK